MIQAVIFDMDGVIVDSEAMHVKIERDLLKKYGGKIEPHYLEQFSGTTDSFFWKSIIEKFDLNVTAKQLSAEKDKIVMSKLKDMRLFPGIRTLLNNLKEKNIKIALASSSKRSWINEVIHNNNLHFNYIISGESLHKPKPMPDIFLHAAEHLNLPPSSCIVIEDSVNGVKAAKAAGMNCIAITNTFPKEKLVEADYIINNLNEFDSKWLE